MSSTGFGSLYRVDPHRLQRKMKGMESDLTWLEIALWSALNPEFRAGELLGRIVRCAEWVCRVSVFS
jgi:hypothetical protein